MRLSRSVLVGFVCWAISAYALAEQKSKVELESSETIFSVITAINTCGYDADLRRSLQDVQEKLGLSPLTIGPADVEDIFKPTLGAMHLKTEPKN